MNSEEKNIKDQLVELLTSESPDNDTIIELTNKLALLDEENVRFSIDAGLIDRLGKELVAREETAVAELVKNSYDADARNVNLFFIDTDSKGGKIIISDDGIGMNRDQLVKGFMRISSTDKVHEPVSPRFKRNRAGRKGIGRFAAQRLGKKLTIKTQIQSQPNALLLSIDWQGYSKDLNLNSISNKLNYEEKDREEGTDIIIDEAREVWSDASIRRIFRYISELLQPFPLVLDTAKIKSKIFKEKSEVNDALPEFEVSFYKIQGGDKWKIADTQSEIFDYALAEIEGYVDSDHDAYFSVKNRGSSDIEILEIKNSDDEPLKFPALENVQFKFYYFILSSTYLPKMQLTRIRELANISGGIRLYRNGFRVLPYGEPGNDWLDLDKISTRRDVSSGKAPISNRNFFGFVQVIDQEGEFFEETASREGLVENDAFDQLKNFVQSSIAQARIRIASHQTVFKQTRKEKVDVDTRQTLRNLETKIVGFLDGLENEKDYKAGLSIRTEIKHFIDELEDQYKAKIEEIGMMRVLASMGQAIGEFTHEIEQFYPKFNGELEVLKSLKTLPEQDEAIERIEEHLSSFLSYTSFFDEAISRNVSRELEPIELSRQVTEFIELIRNDASQSTIEVPLLESYDDYEFLTRPMHPSEWHSILFNLYTNAKKAIKRQKIVDNDLVGKIKIILGKENGSIYLEFMDNGDGVPEDIRERIFDAFFTTSTPKGIEAGEEITGTGLGLKIIQDIVTGYGGQIYLGEPDSDFKTCFRIELKEASEAEKKEYGY